ncbi:MAG TPA: 4-hydroxybenzoate octaprenyltransferase [Thermodesulfobacteriaceae bacterium]|nr:4-hydroxybenzoate octaprenyltransferase [Thermodesulfobacteriaceae bacterium]
MFERMRILLDTIKFEHTIFALPFAFLGAFLAADGLPPLDVSFWILAAMVGARTAAMLFNRIVDIPFDAKNPRTRDRALAKGVIRKKDAWLMVAAFSALYFLAAWRLNALALKLSPVVLGILFAYSYTKRFSAVCHVFLGLAIGIAPAAGWIAVRGEVEFLPLLLSAGVMFWIAGFDILYACLDLEFDRAEGLHSIPAAVGARKAFLISAVLHFLAFTSFVMVGITAHLNWIYYLGVLITFMLLVMQRKVVRPDDLSRMNMAFFTMNAVISIVLFSATAVALLWKE